MVRYPQEALGECLLPQTPLLKRMGAVKLEAWRLQARLLTPRGDFSLSALKITAFKTSVGRVPDYVVKSGETLAVPQFQAEVHNIN